MIDFLTAVRLHVFTRPSDLDITTLATMDGSTTKDHLPDEKLEVINDTHGTNIDAVAEKKLLRKLDIRVLPPLFVLFLLAFLDRTNIGKQSCT
jgi:hypothetical protein